MQKRIQIIGPARTDVGAWNVSGISGIPVAELAQVAGIKLVLPPQICMLGEDPQLLSP